MKKKRIRQNLCRCCMPKILLKMKLLSFFILVSAITTIAANSYSQQAKFNISFRDVTVKEVLQKIEDSSEFIFLYSEKSVNVDRKVDINVTNQTIDVVLDQLFNGTKNYYEIRNRQISILEKGLVDLPFSMRNANDLDQQFKTVTGKVTDTTGASLPGVSVVIKGTTSGVITDTDGKYALARVPENSVLQFSFVGMKTQEISVDGKMNINVILAEETVGIEEVVAIGYGTIKKRDLTGAVGSVTNEAVTAISPSTFSQSLQGQISGVQVTSISGRPGADVSVRVRGVGTINNNDPLYIVDGTPIYGAFNSINPADIESMEVLKDASSTAIYGTRGANGVIIITTKRGKEGKAKLSYDAYTGLQSPINRLELLNAKEFALYTNEMRAAQKVDPLTADWAYPDNIPGGIDTDWQAEILRNAVVQNHNLTISGGGNGTLYNISGNYLNQDGIIKNSDFRRYSIRANTDAKITNRIRFGSSMAYSYTVEGLVGSGGTLTQALQQIPTIPVKFEDGSWGGNPGLKDLYTDAANPVSRLTLNKNDQFRNRFLGNAFVEITLMDGLVLKPMYSVDFSNRRNKSFSPNFTEGTTVKPSIDLSQTFANALGQTFEASLAYTKLFNKKHFLSAIGIFSAMEEKAEANSMSTNNLLSTSLPYFDTAIGDLSVSGNGSEWSLLSYTGRINYTFQDKYLLSATVRTDGSSRFGVNNRWAVFPAFSVGWRLSQESFINLPSFIDEFKLRGSWGQSGNQEIGLYSFVGGLDNTRSYVFGKNQDIVPGVAPTSLPNPNLKWEITEQTNLGFDASFFNTRLAFSMNYYIKNTQDMIVRVPIPGFSGISTPPYVNAGSMKNNGWEFDMSYKGNSGELKYAISANIAFNKNKLVDLGHGSEIISGSFSSDGSQVGGKNTTITRPGYPVGSFYGWITDGIFQNQQEINEHATQSPATRPGDIRFVDLNKDGKIDGLDRTIIGNPWPVAVYGFSISSEYRGFDFSVFFQGNAGNDIYNGIRTVYAISNTTHNYLKEVLDRWRGEGTSYENPRAIYRDVPENSRVSNRWVEDGSFLRLKNMTLGYTLPTSLINQFNISSLRFYLSGTNLLTLTKYRGIDPEVGSSSDLATGIDYSIYPVARTITMGLNLTF